MARQKYCPPSQTSFHEWVLHPGDLPSPRAQDSRLGKTRTSGEVTGHTIVPSPPTLGAQPAPQNEFQGCVQY